MENPLIPGGALAALLGLVGFGVWKVRQKRKATQVDSSFLESRLQPDSFFGASGGQRIDTAESNNPTGSSMVYSPSQLDAAGDVDPVAEADVYLAYGRDLQAEEILKEALRTNPQRVAIHAKLLEIYAKRRDAKAFELIATDAYNLTQGNGPEWEHICELGRELDASNPMYRPGGQPGASAVAAMATGAGAGAYMATAPYTAATAPAPMAPQPDADAGAAVDLDLDLDFSLGDEPAAPPPSFTPEPTLAMNVAPPPPEPSGPAPLDMDFNLSPASSSLDMPAPDLAASEPVTLEAPALTLNENSLNFSPEPLTLPEPVAPAAPAPAPAASDAGMIEFDIGSLSLDLGAPARPRPAATTRCRPSSRSPRSSTPSATPTVPAASPRKSWPKPPAT